MKKTLLFTLCILLSGSIALAQTKASSKVSPTKQKKVQRHGGTGCGSDPILPTDGYTTIYDFVPPSSQTFYVVNLKAGHSYSAEVYDSTDVFVVVPSTATLTLVAADCSTPVPATDVASSDPDLTNSFGDRISWIQSGDAEAFLVLNNSDPDNSYSYNIRITDTTLVNPRWTTYVPFVTSYALVNNTEFAISGTLTLFDNNSPGTTYTASITVPAGGEGFEVIPSAGFTVPTNTYGFATFAFVGPAGAITADAVFQNSSGTVVVPSTFAPRNYQH